MTREYYQKHRHEILARAKSESHRAQERAYRAANPEKTKAKHIKAYLKGVYGITLEQYETMLKHQNGKCQICRKESKGRRLAIDHDHVTGIVRGLLCVGCNTLIGKLLDSPMRVRNVIRYLERHAQLKLTV
jgi:hypothetical protein